MINFMKKCDLALHFCFGLGALIAPLIARPFLLPLERSNVSLSTEQPMSLNDNLYDSTTPLPSQYGSEDVMMVYPYGIIGFITLVPACYFLILYLFFRNTKPHPSRDSEDESGVS